MSNCINEKVSALVVDGSSGVGLEYVRYFAQRGINVVVVHPLDAKIDDAYLEISSSHGVEIDGLALDLSSKASLLQLRSHLDGLRISYYVNNAMETWMTELPLQNRLDASRFMDLHMNATVSISLYLLKMMIERNEGVIIQLCPETSRIADAQSGLVFSSARTFARQFARGLSSELKDTKIKVQVVNLGAYDNGSLNRIYSGHKASSRRLISVSELVVRAMKDLEEKLLLSMPCEQRSFFKKIQNITEHVDQRMSKIS
ncbi:MAG: SDR family oxidoreductase [Clostridiaceae bacterium]|nr:SDR family oxidoreductase [Clostridiaceae bacterium]